MFKLENHFDISNVFYFKSLYLKKGFVIVFLAISFTLIAYSGIPVIKNGTNEKQSIFVKGTTGNQEYNMRKGLILITGIDDPRIEVIKLATESELATTHKV